MCPDCRKPKMQFETEKAALRFIEFNGDEIDTHGRELRAYYCPACCCWHISSHGYHSDYSKRTDDMIDRYHVSKANAKTYAEYIQAKNEREKNRVKYPKIHNPKRLFQ